LFHDPWAAALARPLGQARLEASERASGGQNAYLPVRTRFFDDVVVAADWAQQVVLLGGGMDTRAYRLGLAKSTTVFEVDHAEIFTARRRILRDAHATCRRVEVVADLAGDWGPLVRASGLDPQMATLWLAEGLLFYLSEDAVGRLLSAASDLSRSRALFAADLFGTGLLRLSSMQSLVEHRRSIGAPMPFCTDEPPMPFCTDEPAALLSARGWQVETLANPGAMAAAYGRPIAHRPVVDAGSDPTMRTYLALGSRPPHGPAPAPVR
jgi:methyltransferase (TIGR00027 family)